MAEEPYRKLQQQLDQYSFGFPATESGVELKILRKLFTEEMAQVYLNLGLEPETPEMAAKRLSRDLQVVSVLLESMFEKGLIFRFPAQGVLYYSAAPFMVGIYENQVHTMDKELAELIESYFKEVYFEQFSSLPVLPTRILPVNKAIDATQRVSSFEEARDYIMAQERFAISDCACKTQQGKIDNPCSKPMEVCLAFNWYADYLVDAQVARKISREEALEIQKKCDEAGLLTLSGNVSDPIVFCHCCSCCCLALRSFLRRERPADYTCSNYFAEVDADACTACGVCAERCPMGAVSVARDDFAVVNRERCLGCGLCAAGCDFDAIKLQPRPEEKRAGKLESSRELAVKLAQARGKKLEPLFRE